jgi:hypothetical protein
MAILTHLGDVTGLTATSQLLALVASVVWVLKPDVELVELI